MTIKFKLGVVVIGRNEGARLEACLKSIDTKQYPTVYVDSGSSDNSLIIANQLATFVLSLDASKPFSAARARNEGFELLMMHHPELEYVQFVDGDCEVAPQWLEEAMIGLESNKDRAAVVGHLTERHPEASIYNRLCALEWKSSAGDLTDFGALGGISVFRTHIFKKLKGFKVDVIAGEDSELGVRASLLGYTITKLDKNMATHDANMTKFSQWWKRSVRAGHAIGQRAFLNGNSQARDCVKERKSTLFWGVLVPIVALILLIPTKGYSLCILLVYILLAYKVFKYRQKLGDTNQDAWTYAKFIVIGKFANGLGLLKFYFNKIKNQYSIIEYK